MIHICVPTYIISLSLSLPGSNGNEGVTFYPLEIQIFSLTTGCGSISNLGYLLFDGAIYSSEKDADEQLLKVIIIYSWLLSLLIWNYIIANY